MDAKARWEAWLSNPLIDDQTKAELAELAQDQAELQDRFFKWLEFGTGGLRGKIGAGTNRMNVYTVRVATQALANTLKNGGVAEQGVVIAYDSRRMSREFAQAAAGVLVGNGIPVFVFPEVAPTPLLSFAVRFLKTAAGIVITASHNPPQYNGYKVYNSSGGQILSASAEEISCQMAGLSLEEVVFESEPEQSRLFRWVGGEVEEAYFQAILAALPPLQHTGELKVMYTPLHGTGGRYVPEVLRRAGFARVFTVKEQLQPDGEFPTISSPNPEEGSAFELAFAHAEREGCDLVIATDPDADRMGAAVRSGGRWVLLNGNQMGVLLADYLLSRFGDNRLRNGVLIKTIVTTDMVCPLAQAHGVEVRNTLTGFKYIGALMDELAMKERQFIFGFEESYGFLAGTHVRDKDAVMASLLAAQAAAFYAERGLSLLDRLEELFAQYGYYLQGLESFTFASSLEAERSHLLVERLRQHPPISLAGEQVREVRDYGRGVAIDVASGDQNPITLPREDVLQWFTEEGSRISLRPSGTEPKIKLYLEVKGETRAEAERRLAAMRKACRELIEQGLIN